MEYEDSFEEMHDREHAKVKRLETERDAALAKIAELRIVLEVILDLFAAGSGDDSDEYGQACRLAKEIDITPRIPSR